MRVLLDTNFLLIPFTNHIDIFEECQRLLAGKVEFIILACTLQELRSLKGRQRLYARAMLKFITDQSSKFEIVNIQGKADTLIFEYAEKHNSEGLYVGTMDKELKMKLKKIKVKVLGLRGRGHIDFS
ncbi:MAG: PIN domain-containing protein [Candidatus Micrarchaeota archaeon]